jgi:hypothetical protein
VEGVVTEEQQVLNLCYTYPEILDQGDHAGLGELFADCEIHCFASNVARSGPYVGAEGAKAFYDSAVMMHDGSPRTRHVITNVILELSPEQLEAKTRSYFQVVQDAPPGALKIIASGRYRDEYRKVGGRWRFTRKEIWADYMGDVSQHARVR